MKPSKEGEFILKVCKENWLQMSPGEKARFCKLCQKNVFDFSENSNDYFEEIVCLRHVTDSKEKEKEKEKEKNKLLNKINRLIKNK